MNDYSKLKEYLKGIGGGKEITICQGIVKSVSGNLCEVEIGKITIPGVRLRASEAADDNEILVTPRIGTAVVVGSLSGDLTKLAVLQIDHIDSIVVNGGKLGGLVNIGQLTDNINELVEAFNKHTHQVTVAHPGGTFPTVKPAEPAEQFDRGDYEDGSIKH